MNKLLGLFLLFVFVINSYSSPLVIKISREVKNDDFVELASFDAMKYKQIRISVKGNNSGYNNQIGLPDRVDIYGYKDGQELFLGGVSERDVNYSLLVKTPPSKVAIKVRGQGTYKLYVWATQ